MEDTFKDVVSRAVDKHVTWKITSAGELDAWGRLQAVKEIRVKMFTYEGEYGPLTSIVTAVTNEILAREALVYNRVRTLQGL